MFWSGTERMAWFNASVGYSREKVLWSWGINI